MTTFGIEGHDPIRVTNPKQTEREGTKNTHITNKTLIVPLTPQRLEHHIRHGLPATPALGRVAIRVTADTPSIPFLFDKRRRRIERVSALRAEEMAHVPLGAARDHHLALDGRLAALAARAEELVEVEVAEEAQRFVAVGFFQGVHVLLGVAWGNLEFETLLTLVDPREALGALLVGFWVEGYAF